MSEKKFEPIEVELKKGKFYYWCQCGLSKDQPWCDGSHDADFCEPLMVTTNEDKKVKLCTCKRTSNPPYCDNSHCK